MKIVHVISDDKFPKMARRVFEAVFPNENEFVIFTNAKKLVHSQSVNPKIYSRYLILLPFLIRRIVKADVVVFHSMSNDHLKILKALPRSIKTIWIGWGYDYYDLLSDDLLKPETAKLEEQSTEKNKTSVRAFKSCIKNILWAGVDKKILINNVDVFSPVLYEDYQLIKAALPNFQPKYASWNYGTLEDDHIRGFEDKNINGDNVLLGNSATATNNHLDAFESIQRINLNNRKIVVPLSYGDAGYRDIVIEKGNKAFPHAFLPLIDFMPIDDYITVLQSCSIVIMNHLRQQALGNIVIALYMGAKVFLDEKNPIYRFLITNGAIVYKLEELEGECQTLLSNDQVLANRTMLKNYWSKGVILDKTKNLIDVALNS